MPDIDFLGAGDKKNDDKSGADNQQQDLAWSKPEGGAGGMKASRFSFLRFLRTEPKNKPEPAEDKNKIQQSRREILGLIKNHNDNNKVSLPKEKKESILNGFLKAWREKLAARRENHKEVLVDYQKVFTKEKDKKSIFSPLLPSKKPKLEEPIVQVKKSPAEPEKIIKAPEPQPERKIEPEREKIEVQPTAPATYKTDTVSEEAPKVLGTNLIRGEVVTFFDWQRKIFSLAAAIFVPIFLISALYLGLMFYEKKSQEKNLSLVDKFNKLSVAVREEETDAAEVFDFQNKLKIISQVFKQHIYWSNFFKFLEDNTIKDVYYTGFSGDTGGNYSLNAVANNYGNISEQVETLKNNDKTASVKADGGELMTGDEKNKNRVKFNLNFSVSKDIFTE